MRHQIEDLRAQVNAIDEDLLRLLNRRARLATEIGLVKQRERVPLCDPDREREVLQRVSEVNNGPLKEDSVHRIFKVIIDESRQIQSLADEATAKSAIPLWNRATVVGCGLIGASFALALRRAGACRSIAGWDIAEEVRQDALDLGIIDEIDSALADGAVSKSDLIYLAMPVRGIIEFLRQRGPQLKSGAFVTDAGSTKLQICKIARRHLPKNICFAGGHPIAGSEHFGLDHADALLFRDTPYVLCADDEQNSQVQLFKDTLNRIGGRVRFVSAEDHDRVVALTSHLPQLLSSTLAAVAHNEHDFASLLNLGGRGWRDMTRLAASPWPMWAHILETNHAEIRRALDCFTRHLAVVRGELCGPDDHEQRQMPAANKIFTAANDLVQSSNERGSS